MAQSDKGAAWWYTKAAEQGYDVKAQYDLEVMLEDCRRTAQSTKEAIRGYMKAAEQEYAKVLSTLEILHTNGRGAALSDAEAARWSKNAPEQGAVDS